jgi:hypothetical protein
MCFMLYAGTTKPISRRSWDIDARDISVRPLSEDEVSIKAHFKSVEVQYIGSTTGCGCDFPNVMYQNGGWPVCEDDEVDEEQAASDRFNKEALAALLRATGEEGVELYGIWAGHSIEEPIIYEEISLDNILGSNFYFKERGFYRVIL